MKFRDYITEEVNLKKVADEMMYKFRLTRNTISVNPNVNTGEEQIELHGHGPLKHFKKFIEENYPELKFYGYKRGKAFFVTISKK